MEKQNEDGFDSVLVCFVINEIVIPFTIDKLLLFNVPVFGTSDAAEAWTRWITRNYVAASISHLAYKK